MGVCNIPNIFQQNISKPFNGLDMVCTFIEDILVITKNDFTEHLKALDRVLQRHLEVVLKVNTRK